MAYEPIVVSFERDERLPPSVDPRLTFDALARTLFDLVPDLVRFRIAYDVRTSAVSVATPGYVVTEEIEPRLRECLPSWVTVSFSSRIIDEVAL